MLPRTVIRPCSVTGPDSVVSQFPVIPAKAGIHPRNRFESGRKARRPFRLANAKPADGPRLAGRGDECLSGGYC